MLKYLATYWDSPIVPTMAWVPTRNTYFIVVTGTSLLQIGPKAY
jgi:hypothetical protein